MTPTRLATTLLLALVLLAAGCGGGGGGDGSAGTTPSGTVGDDGATPTPPPDDEAYGVEDPAPGQTLLRFVRAAGDGDVEGMWELLSTPTQASIGPTAPDFQRGAAREFEEGLGTLADSAEVHLSRVLGEWGAAAVTGTRTAEGQEEFYAYGAALVQEDGEWRLDLGGLVVTQLQPEPLAETEALPELRASIGAGGPVAVTLLYLDAEPLQAQRSGDTPFAVTLRATPVAPLAAGRHVALVFASSGETATALAWPFTVEGER
jgi:hypothetical protein